MLGLHLLLAFTSLFLPNAIQQGPIYGGTSGGGGGSITYGSAAGCGNGSTTTTVSTNQAGVGCTSLTTVNLPSGALAWGACMFQGTVGTETIAYTDTAGNVYSPGTTLQFNAAAGSFQMFFAKNTTANASDAGTCTISASVGGSATSAAILGYITGANTSTPQDVSNAGNANDGGSSGTTFTSANFSTTNATEYVLACAASSTNNTFTVGTIGGVGATIAFTSSQVPNGAGTGILGCEYRITSGTLSTQNANFTYSASSRWNIGVNSFHP